MTNHAVEIITPERVASCFAPRPADSHKGSYGRLLAVCGNGHTLAANLMAALQKILEEGAARLAEAKAASL